ncbi:hypothetical protein BHE90_005977 [Fusarium euwallaceae]|uniref:Uncharacterized protein n=1 Tax=Fusarium euwallaceae TaxID=1147111 RepID=A0A430LUX9_9HYPO|nr:hypothetical protein BHE90_005977 [Fusarium euwallaceae]
MNTYVVAPNFSIAPPAPPPTGENGTVPSSSDRVQLGDILVDPFGPQLVAINRDCRVAIDGKLLEKVDIKGEFKTTRKKLLEGRFGLGATLLAALGIGSVIDIGLFVKRNCTDELTIDSLETHEFRVTDAYLKNVLAPQSIKDYLKEYPGSTLYMISGLKIAKGVSAKSKTDVTVKANAGAGDDGAVNINLLKFLWKRSRGQSFESSTDFVLAFQLVHIIDPKGKPKHELSLEKVTLSDGTVKSQEVEVHYEVTDCELSVPEGTDYEVVKSEMVEINGPPEQIIVPDIESDEDDEL